jgi:hypothetical protein
MSRHHLIYFENASGHSRPKSKSYSRLRLEETAAGRRNASSSGKRAKHKRPASSATASVAVAAGEEGEGDAMAETFVATWGATANTSPSPTSPPGKDIGGVNPRALVNSWMNSAICKLAPLSGAASGAHDSGPEPLTLIGSARRCSEPANLLESLKEKFLRWKECHLTHLKQEESVTMPLTQQVDPSHLGRCRAVHHCLLSPALSRSPGEFLSLIAWVTAKLGAQGAGAGGEGEGAVCEYVRALHSASSSAQWAEVGPAVRASCPRDVWVSMVKRFSVNLPFGDDILLSSLSPKFAANPPVGKMIRVWLIYMHILYVYCVYIQLRFIVLILHYYIFLTLPLQPSPY